MASEFCRLELTGLRSRSLGFLLRGVSIGPTFLRAVSSRTPLGVSSLRETRREGGPLGNVRE